MTKFVGRRGTLGLALEATRGIAVNPVYWVPWATMSFKDTTDESREDQGLGKIADGDSKYMVMKYGEGDVEEEFYDRALGVILAGVTGAKPVTSGSGPFTHTFTLSQTNTGQSLSLYWSDPDRNDMYPLAMVDSFNIKIEPKAKVEYKVGFKSKTAKEWAAQTANFTTLGSKFLHQHLQFRLAPTVAGLAAAIPISLKNLDITFNRNVMYDAVMGTVEPEDILNQQLGIEGSIELNLVDDTFRDYMLNGTYQAMEIRLVGSATSSLQIQLPRVDFSEWDPDYKVNDIVTQKINFKANYDAANALDIISLLVLINQNPSY